MIPPNHSPRVRVLVVADNPDTREYLQDCLGPERYEVDLAASGAEGLHLAQLNSPAATLIDLSPQGSMDGFQVCRALRSDPQTAHSALIYLSQRAGEEELGAAFEAGADDFLVKPFQPQELLTRLEARLASRGRSGQLANLWLDELAVLLELNRLLASSLDLGELLHLVSRRTAEVLKVDRCSVVLLSAESSRVLVVAASEDATVRGIEVALENYPEIQEVLRTHRPLVVERVEDSPTLQTILPTLNSKGIGSLALFPMMHDERVDGVLFLRSERFGRRLEERDIFFANAVAASVALALRNVHIANELRRTKQFMENVIDSSVDAIIAADMKGDVILFNQGAERILGYKASEVIGKLNVRSLYPPGVAEEIMRLLREDRNGGPGRLNTTRKEVIAANGEVIPIHLTAWTVMEDGRETATAGIFSDLRERLTIERKLSQAQEKLLKSQQQAMIAELAGATAHELNQPLTSVLGYAEMARRKITNAEEVGRLVDVIISETERMADIVRKIGRITRYETKSYVGGQRIVDLDRSSDPE